MEYISDKIYGLKTDIFLKKQFVKWGHAILIIIVGLLYCGTGLKLLEEKEGCFGQILQIMVPWSYIILAGLFSGMIWRSHVYVVTGEKKAIYHDNILLWDTKYSINGKEYKLISGKDGCAVINEYKKDVVVDEKRYSIIPITFDQLKHIVIKPGQIQYFKHGIDYLGDDVPSSISSSEGKELIRYQLHESHDVNPGLEYEIEGSDFKNNIKATRHIGDFASW